MASKTQLTKAKDLEQYEIDRAYFDFYAYCQLLAPEFYTEDKIHLKILCKTLQDFRNGKLLKEDGTPHDTLVIQLPPRHGKTRTLILFSSWLIGRKPEEMILTAAYNDAFAGDFSKYTRNTIAETRNIETQTIYSDIFNVKIKQGEGGSKQWAVEGQHFTFKSVGKGGGVTGKGGNWLIIDDPVKNAEDAFNEGQLDKDNLWYTGTWLSRKEHHAKEIICHTPWAKKDIGGRIIKDRECYVLSMPAYDGKKMLCNSILDKKEYDKLKNEMEPSIFEANYNMERIDVRGLLYGTDWKTYEKLPMTEDGHHLSSAPRLWADTADKGTDYLCAIIGRVYDDMVYVTDVYYTKDGVEVTEEELARRTIENKIYDSLYEANGMGSVIAKHVDKILQEKYTWYSNVMTYNQSQNKLARILANAGTVKQKIIFPVGWEHKWPVFYRALITFMKEGKNKNDDAPDVLTAIVERMEIKEQHFFRKRK